VTLRDAFLTELDVEAPFSRRTLERVPLDKRAWKPHDKSMPLGWLATFLCLIWGWGVITLEQDSFDPTRAGSGQRPPEPETTATLLALFDQNVSAYRAALEKTNDDRLREPWTLLANGQPFFKQPRWIVLRTFLMNHAIHHRAQLGVYLRLNGIAVPAIYNDSADEKGGLFR